MVVTKTLWDLCLHLQGEKRSQVQTKWQHQIPEDSTLQMHLCHFLFKKSVIQFTVKFMKFVEFYVTSFHTVDTVGGCLSTGFLTFPFIFLSKLTCLVHAELQPITCSIKGQVSCPVFVSYIRLS
jgi:hypothetical protein